MKNKKVKILLKFINYVPAYIFLRPEDYVPKEDECELAITVREFASQIMEVFAEYFKEIFDIQRKLMEEE